MNNSPVKSELYVALEMVELTQFLPFTNFLIAYRLKMAAKKIAETDDKIVNISTDCGFNNQSYFSRAFTKHFKMSPAEYRNKH